MIKYITMMTRKDEMSHAAFVKYWFDIHAPLVRQCGEYRRYAMNQIDQTNDTGAVLPLLDVQIDGIEEMWFDDEESAARFDRSDAAQKANIDLANFAGWIKKYRVFESE